MVIGGAIASIEFGSTALVFVSTDDIVTDIIPD
jgi:hypothetical protein